MIKSSQPAPLPPFPLPPDKRYRLQKDDPFGLSTMWLLSGEKPELLRRILSGLPSQFSTPMWVSSRAPSSSDYDYVKNWNIGSAFARGQALYPKRFSRLHDTGHYRQLLDLFPIMGRAYDPIDTSSVDKFLETAWPSIKDRVGYESQLAAMYSRPRDWAGLGAALGLSGTALIPTLRRVRTRVDPIVHTRARLDDKYHLFENLNTGRIGRVRHPSVRSAWKALFPAPNETTAYLRGLMSPSSGTKTYNYIAMQPRRLAPGNFRLGIGIRPRTTRGAVLWPLLASLAGAGAGVAARRWLAGERLTEIP